MNKAECRAEELEWVVATVPSVVNKLFPLCMQSPDLCLHYLWVHASLGTSSILDHGNGACSHCVRSPNYTHR